MSERAAEDADDLDQMELPSWETEVTFSEQFVCALADALREGDEVILNERQRPITVLGREIDDGGFVAASDYPYKHVHLRGNGTEYRMRYSHTGEYYPTVCTESELITEQYQGEPRTRSKTGAGRQVKRIEVVGVENRELAHWGIQRNISGVEDVE